LEDGFEDCPFLVVQVGLVGFSCNGLHSGIVDRIPDAPYLLDSLSHFLVIF
jgi:hypothetical protein